MPVVEHPEHPRRRVLTGADGAPLAHFEAAERDGRRVADFFAPADGIEPAHAAAEAVAQLSGWRVAADPAFAALMIAAGGRAGRHAHVLSRDLVRDPAPDGWLEPRTPPGYRLTAVDRPPGDLADACIAAYPPDHPDFDEIPERGRPDLELADLMEGRVIGPMLRCSGLIVRADGTVAGAVIVTASDDAPPLGGPWIGQIFRHPDAAGTGGPLLRRALAVATRDGLPALSLAVTHTNPARALYAAFGFTEALESRSVQL